MDRMLSEQIGLWSMQQKKERRSRPYRPVITISRSCGAGGAELGRRLGARIGFPVWDRELVHAIAEERGGDERLMATLDEHRRSQVDETLRSLILGMDQTNNKYFWSLMRIVRTLSQHGSCIIVGRGANFAVSAERALRVRVDSPIEWRAARLAHQNGWQLERARGEAVRKDAERADFVRHHFKADVADGSNYDLTVNPENLSPSGMVDLIERAYEARFAQAALPSPVPG
jgi:cytidylate kinase